MQKLQYMILKFILDNQLENARTAKSILLNLLKWNVDIGKILFTLLSSVKHKQFDCSLRVNRKSIEEIRISFNI